MAQKRRQRLVDVFRRARAPRRRGSAPARRYAWSRNRRRCRRRAASGFCSKRRGEDIVDDEHAAGLMRQLGDGFQIDQLQARIGRALAEYRFDAGLQRLAPLIEIGAVDQLALHAIARQDFLNDVEAGAEQRARGDDAVAGLEEAGHRGKDRGHAGRRAAHSFGAFEQAQPLLEHRDRRIGVARIDIARALVLERFLGFLGALIDEARGHVDRFASLFELRALQAAMRQHRARAPFRGMLGIDHRHRRSPSRYTPTGSRPLRRPRQKTGANKKALTARVRASSEPPTF